MGVEVGFEGLRGGFYVSFLHESIVFDTNNLILRFKIFFMRAILSYGRGSLGEDLEKHSGAWLE